MAIIDLFSRFPIALVAFDLHPTARDVRRVLHGAIRIRGRYGAVASNQSVAVIERFWESMKREALAEFFGFRSLSWIQRRLVLYQRWFNGARPHGGLRGAVPNEIHWGRRPATLRPRVSVCRARLTRLDLGGVAAFPIYRLRAAV